MKHTKNRSITFNFKLKSQFFGATRQIGKMSVNTQTILVIVITYSPFAILFPQIILIAIAYDSL